MTEKLDNETVQAIIANHATKSSAIRDLSSRGMTRSEIAKAMGIRYQHVRNVLVNPPKKAQQ